MKKTSHNLVLALVAALAFSSVVGSVAQATEPTPKTNITGFSGQASKLRLAQETAVVSALALNPNATSINCVGLTAKNPKAADKKLALARAKAACGYTKKVLPALKVKSLVATTNSQRERGQVQLAFASPIPTHVPSETELSFTVTRNLVDQPDSVRGLQVKPIYLVASDSVDEYLDVNGRITEFLDEGNAFVEREISKRFAIDRLADGSYDIGFVKSKLSLADIYSTFNADTLWLRNVLNGTPFAEFGENRKIYAIFVAGPGTDEFCGFGDMPGRHSVNMTQGNCTGPSRGLENFESRLWVHEVFHNLGVEHVEESCDLMGSSEDYDAEPCYRDQPQTIDTQRRYYVNAKAAGVDILKSGVWEGENLRAKNAKGVCTEISSSGTWSEFLCPTGKIQLGPRDWCWDKVRSAQLQVLKDGKWVRVASGKGSKTPWGDKDVWVCSDRRYAAAPTATLTLSAGTNWYRWLVNGSTELPFRVRVQN